MRNVDSSLSGFRGIVLSTMYPMVSRTTAVMV